MKRLRMVGLAVAGLIGFTAIAFAAGLWPDFPIVGGATYCAGSSQSAVGTIIGSVTGCPNQVPAGPTIVTGNEQIPADTRLSSGATPQTVLIPMASLNALPITVSRANVTGSNLVSAANNSGGFILWSPNANVSALNITLPASPIDGQQYIVGSNQTILILSVASTPTVQSVSNSPSILTVSTTTGSQGYRWMFNAAQSTWFRLQ